MPVAALPTYDEMWVHPQVVAALCDTFEYTAADPWDPTASYGVCDHVVDGNPDVPYGGYIWTATAVPGVGVGPLTEGQTVWERDDALLGARLALYTATTQATWLLDAYTKFKLHGIQCWQEDYRVHSCTVRLRRNPVEAIGAVTRMRGGAAYGEVANWSWKSKQEIQVCCDGCGFTTFDSACQDNVVRIVYRIGSTIPPGTESLVAWLACNYGKAALGQSCALPERLQTVTRQGVSWTILDPQDFLDQGKTGMPRVDSWLSAVRYTQGGTLIDPFKSDRLFSTRLDCDADWPVTEP
jgi:hypothetical protein